MEKERGQEQNQNSEKYSFMQEIIKDEQTSWRHALVKIIRFVAIGVLFGMGACIGFAALMPWAKDTFSGQENEVEIQQEEEPEKVVETIDPELIDREHTIDDYRELHSVFEQVVREAKKCVVDVSGVTQDVNWPAVQSGEMITTAGLIVGDNGKELLVLADAKALKQSTAFTVKFVDEGEYEASLKQKDTNSNLAILSVAKSAISKETSERIMIAEFGNSTLVGQGKTLFALGRPFGYEDGVGFGVSSTVTATAPLADGIYNLIVTDMPCSQDGSGFLFDTYGHVIGMLTSHLGETYGVLTAIGTSGVLNEIQMLSNDKQVPYIGIYGTVATKEMAEQNGIPEGIYVTEVEVDSPAMQAGIQSGDIITKVGKTKVKTMAEYHNVVISQENNDTITIGGKRLGADTYVDIQFSVTVGVKQ